jgi:hypothetical protein
MGAPDALLENIGDISLPWTNAIAHEQFVILVSTKTTEQTNITTNKHNKRIEQTMRASRIPGHP